ncbi:hypothetical protein BESB_048510 [Besnoitia besnoiti]|uniref:Uncharacterized protein n=1 Tax=Besnoitia besnoiti TaxID=94643 RepID=A0A2A9MFG5_BESBE|nr:hypothetical protein BESB_048510 [Besnoitia besnoiti]PFH36659.1 hypothetical protein BESB_048510 [Besnoitia besnoiti]
MLPYQQKASSSCPPPASAGAPSPAPRPAPYYPPSASLPHSPSPTPYSSAASLPLPLAAPAAASFAGAGPAHGPPVLLLSSRGLGAFSVPSPSLQHFFRLCMQQLATAQGAQAARWREEGRVTPEKNLQVLMVIQQFRERKASDRETPLTQRRCGARRLPCAGFRLQIGLAFASLSQRLRGAESEAWGSGVAASAAEALAAPAWQATCVASCAFPFLKAPHRSAVSFVPAAAERRATQIPPDGHPRKDISPSVRSRRRRQRCCGRTLRASERVGFSGAAGSPAWGASAWSLCFLSWVCRDLFQTIVDDCIAAQAVQDVAGAASAAPAAVGSAPSFSSATALPYSASSPAVSPLSSGVREDDAATRSSLSPLPSAASQRPPREGGESPGTPQKREGDDAERRRSGSARASGTREEKKGGALTPGERTPPKPRSVSPAAGPSTPPRGDGLPAPLPGALSPMKTAKLGARESDSSLSRGRAVMKPVPSPASLALRGADGEKTEGASAALGTPASAPPAAPGLAGLPPSGSVGPAAAASSVSSFSSPAARIVAPSCGGAAPPFAAAAARGAKGEGALAGPGAGAPPSAPVSAPSRAAAASRAHASASLPASALTSEYRENMSPLWWVGAALGREFWRQMSSSSEVIELVEKKKLTEQFRTLEGLVDRADFLGSLRLQGDCRNVLHFLGLSSNDLQQSLWQPTFPTILPPRAKAPAPSPAGQASAASFSTEDFSADRPPATKARISSASAPSSEPHARRRRPGTRFCFPPQLIWERLRVLRPALFVSLASAAPDSRAFAREAVCSQPNVQLASAAASLNREEGKRLLPSFSLLATVAQELDGSAFCEDETYPVADADDAAAEGEDSRRGASGEPDALKSDEERTPGVACEGGYARAGQKVPNAENAGGGADPTTDDPSAHPPVDARASCASSAEDYSPPPLSALDPYTDQAYLGSSLPRSGASGYALSEACAGAEGASVSEEGTESQPLLFVDREAISDLAHVTQTALRDLLSSALAVAMKREEQVARRDEERLGAERAAWEKVAKRAAAQSRGHTHPAKRRRRDEGDDEVHTERDGSESRREEESRSSEEEGSDEGEKGRGVPEDEEEKEDDETPASYAGEGLGKRRPRHFWENRDRTQQQAVQAGLESQAAGGEASPKEAGKRDKNEREPSGEKGDSQPAADATHNAPQGDAVRAGGAASVAASEAGRVDGKDDEEMKRQPRITVSDVLRALELHGGSIGMLLRHAEQRHRRRAQEEVFSFLSLAVKKKRAWHDALA